MVTFGPKIEWMSKSLLIGWLLYEVEIYDKQIPKIAPKQCQQKNNKFVSSEKGRTKKKKNTT